MAPSGLALGSSVGAPTSVTLPPALVLGNTSRRSFMLIGDSIMAGNGTDARDWNGDFGMIARALGGLRGYSNFGRP